jgi:CHAD domain-containing protein
MTRQRRQRVSRAPGVAGERAAGSALARLFKRLHQRVARGAALTARNPGPDNLHDMRIEVRRLRAVARALTAELNPQLAAELRFDLKNLTRETGPLRDADVSRALLLARIRDSLELPLEVKRDAAVALEQARVDARRALRQTMREPAWSARLERIRAAARSPDLLASLAQPLAAVVHDALGPQLVELRRRMGRRRLDADRLHRIRMRARDARYTAEALLPLLRRRAAPLGDSLHELQSSLGSAHDVIEARRLVEQGGLPIAAREVLVREFDALAVRQLKRCRKRLRRLADKPPAAWRPWLA